MPRQGTQFLSRDRIPKFNGLIKTGCGQEFPIGGEGDARDLSRMIGKRVLFLSGGNIPKFGGLIETPCGQEFTIGGEGDVGDLVGMTN